MIKMLYPPYCIWILLSNLTGVFIPYGFQRRICACLTNPCQISFGYLIDIRILLHIFQYHKNGPQINCSDHFWNIWSISDRSCFLKELLQSLELSLWLSLDIEEIRIIHLVPCNMYTVWYHLSVYGEFYM